MVKFLRLLNWFWSINTVRKISRLEWILTGIVFLLLSFIGLTTNTTGDNGDSVMHYLFSHYAFDHPSNFLDHWAKPFFVLLSAPFAYFGFKGMILFNILCVSLTALFTYYVAKNLKLKYPLLVFPLLLGAPLFFKLTFSGLTEYLFGLILVISIYLIQKNKKVPALILVSFLPMVRSEGLIILGIFGLFLLIEKSFKFIPYLLTGQLFYTLVGAIYYGDSLWVIRHIPYANMDSPYGSGNLFDFVFRLMYVIEKPLMLLLIVGISVWLWQWIRSRNYKENSVRYILVMGSFAALFLTHSLFWYFGIFNSMGLPRVLIVVVPLIVIIALAAINYLIDKWLGEKWQKGVAVGTGLIILGFPIIPRDNGVVYSKTMLEIPDHQMIDREVVPFIQETFPDFSEKLIYFSQPYLSIALDVDYFDQSKHLEIQHIKDGILPNNVIVIWDSWFSVSDGGIALDDLVNHSQLKVKGTFTQITNQGENRFVIFESKAKSYD